MAGFPLVKGDWGDPPPPPHPPQPEKLACPPMFPSILPPKC